LENKGVQDHQEIREKLENQVTVVEMDNQDQEEQWDNADQ